MAPDAPSTLAADACLVAHGAPDTAPTAARSLVLVYAGQISRHLAVFAAACDYRVSVVEPDAGLATEAVAWAGQVFSRVDAAAGDESTDIVVTDHHRADLGIVLRDALAVPSRWVGVVGNPRHVGPHVAMLTELGVAPEEIARVHRPIGLNIGSRSPAEVALSTLAGLLADRQGRPGGFDFTV